MSAEKGNGVLTNSHGPEDEVAEVAAHDFKASIAQFTYSPQQSVESPRLTRKRTAASTTRGSRTPSRPQRKRSHTSALTDNDKGERDEELDNSADSLTNDMKTIRSPRKRRTTTKQRSAKDPHNPTNNLVDSLRPGLTLVCIGLNPGLTTAFTGHAYAHPSNRFWHLLYASGITIDKHIPAETRDLMDLYSIGNTNICARPTRSGDGLSKQEMEEGAVILDAKIARYRPQAVAIIGKSIWETIWKSKTGRKTLGKNEFHWGWQNESLQLGRTVENGEVVWVGAKTFVATSTSGLAATLTPDEKLAIWRPLGEFMQARRATQPDNS